LFNGSKHLNSLAFVTYHIKKTYTLLSHFVDYRTGLNKIANEYIRRSIVVLLEHEFVSNILPYITEEAKAYFFFNAYPSYID